MIKGFRLIAWLGVLLPAAAFAVAGWTSLSPIVELTPTVNGRFLVTLKVAENPSGCRSSNQFYLDFGLPGSEQMFQTLLEAVAHDKLVRVYVTGKCDLNGYSEITSVGIVP